MPAEPAETELEPHHSPVAAAGAPAPIGSQRARSRPGRPCAESPAVALARGHVGTWAACSGVPPAVSAECPATTARGSRPVPTWPGRPGGPAASACCRRQAEAATRQAHVGSRAVGPRAASLIRRVGPVWACRPAAQPRLTRPSQAHRRPAAPRECFWIHSNVHPALDTGMWPAPHFCGSEDIFHYVEEQARRIWKWRSRSIRRRSTDLTM